MSNMIVETQPESENIEQEKKRAKKVRNIIFLIEVVLVFLIVSGTMLFTIWTDIVQKNYSQFTNGLFMSVIKNALEQTVLYILGYSLVKRLYSHFHTWIEKGAHFLEELNRKQIFVIHIFVITTLIVSISPIRPVIQRPYYSSTFDSIQDVAVGFTNYDFVHTIWLLVPLLLIAILFLFALNRNLTKAGLTKLSLLFVVFALLCSLYNYKAQFKSKIFEARGYMNMSQEVTELEEHSDVDTLYQKNVGIEVLKKAKEAYALAKNNEEKALALRWIANGYSLQEENEMAYQAINESISLDPQDYAYGEYIYILIDLKKYLQAIEIGEKCLSINPEAFYCYAPLAKAQWFMGDYELAKGTMQKAVSISPRSKLLNDILLYYEKNIPVKISHYSAEERELRKNNEPVNICLMDVEDLYFDLAKKYCELEGKERSCKEITGAHWAELETTVSYRRQDCFNMYTAIR